MKVLTPSIVGGTIPPYAKRPIRTAKDAKKMLGKLIHAFQQGQINQDGAKTLCYLLISFVQIIRDGEFEGRLTKLEQDLKSKGQK